MVAFYLVLAVALRLLQMGECKDVVDNSDIVLLRMSREIDLTSQLVKCQVAVTLQNAGNKPLTSFLYTVDANLAKDLSFLGAEVEELALEVGGTSDAGSYEIRLPTPLDSGKSTKVNVVTVFSHTIAPFPKEISQNDNQLVQFNGNAYVFSPYVCKSQSTTVLLPSSTIESFTRVPPVNSVDKEIAYGPYTDVAPHSYTRISIHYLSNQPFIAVVGLQRLIEISHWGNIAVEENIHIRHEGALLKGSFSRFDYQRNPNSGLSSLKSYKTLLPAAARDVYYRDEIGNISTSHLLEEEEFVEVELRPRFPLFGGWQTCYCLGYNVPSYEYLWHAGNQYMLKMRFVDHILDNQVIDSAVVKVILPEGAKNVSVMLPFAAREHVREVHYTYLDTVGRPVVVISKENLVEQHIQDFEIYYEFQSILLLQEPLLVVVALYLFFVLVIIMVRLDFSIRKDEAVLAKQQALVFSEEVLAAHDQRSLLIPRYSSAIAAYKQSKDVRTFKSSRKSLDDKFAELTNVIGKAQKKLHSVDPDASAKVSELQRKAMEVKAVLEENCQLAERLLMERITRNEYLEKEKANQSKLVRLQSEMDIVLKSL